MTLSARMFVWGFGTAVAVIAFIVLAILYGGSYNIAANDPHTSLMRWALNHTIHSSVEKATETLKAPESFSDEQVAAGAVLFAKSCAHCHGAPGEEPATWSRGMLPLPPDLVEHAGHMESKAAFWIIQNGLKFTGMPAFSERYNEDELWRLTAFVSRLDEISAEQYAALTAPEEPAPPPPAAEPETPPAAEPETPAAEPETQAKPDATTTAPEQPASPPEQPAAEETPAAAQPEQDAATPPAAEEPAAEQTPPAGQSRATEPAQEPDEAAPAQADTEDRSAPSEQDQAAPAEPPEAQPEQTARATPADEPAEQTEPAATGEPVQATMADRPAASIPVPPRMETVQTVTDEEKLEPSLRPLPPAPATESQWPAQ